MQINKLIKKEVISLITTLILILIIFISVSFGGFFNVAEGQTNTISFGDVDFKFCKGIDNTNGCTGGFTNYGQTIGLIDNGDGTTGYSTIYPYESTSEALDELNPYIFNVENTGSLKLYLNAYLESDPSSAPQTGYTSLTSAFGSHLKIGVSDCTSSINKNVKVLTYSELNNNKILINETLEVGENKSYCIWIWLDDTTPNDAQQTYFIANLRVSGEYYPRELVSGCDDDSTNVNCIVAKNVTTPTTINYKRPSGPTNGEGLFKYNKLTTPLIMGENNVIDDPTGISNVGIYYYRGNITNNNVIFGGYCWLIVRTTDTGGTKLLYNGPVQDAEIKCPSYRTTESDNPLMDTSERWDSTSPYTDVRYAGSGPKSVLDNWYSTWITNNPEIDDKLESIVWCNDVNNQTLLESAGDYPAKDRLEDASTVTPQLECKYEADRYTSKIGLLTADEAVLAGQTVYVSDSTNKNSYINIASKTWWLGSPYRNDSSFGGVFYSNGDSAKVSGVYVDRYFGARGSVSLSSNVKIISGSGTASDPYMVE